MVRGGRVSPAVWRFWSCKRLLRKLSEAECRAFADAYLGQACPPGLMALVLRFRERGRETPAGRISMLWSAACARRRYHGLL